MRSRREVGGASGVTWVMAVRGMVRASPQGDGTDMV
jgi:hypothetical protein